MHARSPCTIQQHPAWTARVLAKAARILHETVRLSRRRDYSPGRHTSSKTSASNLFARNAILGNPAKDSPCSGNHESRLALPGRLVQDSWRTRLRRGVGFNSWFRQKAAQLYAIYQAFVAAFARTRVSGSPRRFCPVRSCSLAPFAHLLVRVGRCSQRSLGKSLRNPPKAQIYHRFSDSLIFT